MGQCPLTRRQTWLRPRRLPPMERSPCTSLLWQELEHPRLEQWTNPTHWQASALDKDTSWRSGRVQACPNQPGTLPGNCSGLSRDIWAGCVAAQSSLEDNINCPECEVMIHQSH